MGVEGQKSTRRARRTNERKAAMSQYAAEKQAALEVGDEHLPPEARAFAEKLRTDPVFFCEQLLHVPHIDGGRTVPFILNEAQRAVGEKIKEIQAAGKPVRLCILKSRRRGMSAFCQALSYQFTSTRRNVNGLVLAHKQDMTLKLFQLAKTFHQLDERRTLGIRPETETSTRRELKFGNPDLKTRDINPGLQSLLDITSAEAKEPGRAGTYHFVHASEVAFYQDDSVWQSVGIALSDTPDTVAIMESTANGRGGLFYETYMAAKEGTNGWVAMFFPWWTDPRCTLPLDREEREHWRWETQEEEQYAKKWNLTPEQAKWRRVTIKGPKCYKPGVKPEDVFAQEFPADDEEAFLATGNNFFLPSTLYTCEKVYLEDPAYRCELRTNKKLDYNLSPDARGQIQVEVERQSYGPLVVYRDPRPDEEYVIGADVAEGLSHGDNSVAVVLARSNLEMVAVWQGRHLTASQFGRAAGLLGWWYGTALLGVEANAHGLAATDELTRLMYPYLWHHTDVTTAGAIPREKVGWVTSQASRQYMLDCLEQEIRSGNIRIHAKPFFTEAKDFVIIDGKPQARVGRHDDVIMATAIALQMHMHAGPPRRRPEAAKEPEGPRLLVPAMPELRIREVGLRRHIRSGALWGEE